MNKILEEIGVKQSNLPWNWYSDFDDIREAIWEKEKEENGFDSRDTWHLDETILYLLYPRFVKYYELADVNINLDLHKYTIDGKEYTQRELLIYIIDAMKNQIKFNIGENNKEQDMVKVFNIIGTIFGSLWW